MEPITDIRRIQKLCFEIASEKGWHEKENPFGQIISNIHSEISEAWEWYRCGNAQSNHIPQFSGIEEEFADVIIRILDTAEEMQLDVLGAMSAKMEYNKTRPHRHGGKLA